MKATLILLADVEAETFGRKCMLKAHRAGDIGLEMARIPHHISLKQPYFWSHNKNMHVLNISKSLTSIQMVRLLL